MQYTVEELCESIILSGGTHINYFHGTNGSQKIKKVFCELALTTLSQGPRVTNSPISCSI